MACKNKWLNLRDQYRRTVRKQKIADSQGIKKKKWRFEDDMTFLIPFLREKTTNPDSFHTKIESDEAECDDSEQILTFDEEGDETMLTSSKIIDDFSQFNEPKPKETTPLDAFFVAMAETVKTFTPIYQNIAKKRIFNIVSGIEMEILQQNDDRMIVTESITKEEVFLTDT